MKGRVIHLQNQEPIVNMKLLLMILLAVACPSIHTNHRTKLGEVSQSKGPNLRNSSSTWGTRHYSCNAYPNRGKNQHIINAGSKIRT